MEAAAQGSDIKMEMNIGKLDNTKIDFLKESVPICVPICL